MGYRNNVIPITPMVAPTGVIGAFVSAQLRDFDDGYRSGHMFAPFTDNVVITTAFLPSGSIGIPYSATLTAVGGTLPYTWAMTGTLQGGLTFNSAAGTITGTPLADGTVSLIFTATDAVGRMSVPVDLSLQVAGSLGAFLYAAGDSRLLQSRFGFWVAPVNAAAAPPAGFDFFVSPTGDDITGAGTLASPWSATALGTLANAGTAACKWTTYAGKRVGVLPGRYTGGTANGVVTTFYNLAQNPDQFGPGCVLLVNGGTPSSPTLIGACNAAGKPFTAPYGRPTAVFDGTRYGVVPQYAATLFGQTEDGSNGNSTLIPPNFGNIIVDGLCITGFCSGGAGFGDNAHPNTAGVVFRNCEVSIGAGFHDDNHHGVQFSGCTGAQMQNCWVHDIMSVPNTFHSQFTASFAGTVMTVSALIFGSLSYEAIAGQFVYGPGLPAGLTIASAGTGTGGAGTYNLSASVPTLASGTYSAGYAGSVLTWGGYGVCHFNGGVTPTVHTNCTFQRCGLLGLKTANQTSVFSYCYLELGSYGTFPNVSGAGAYGEIFFNTPAGGASVMDHCVVTTPGIRPTNNGTGGASSTQNQGTLQLTNLTFYVPTGVTPTLFISGLQNSAASPIGTSLMQGILAWSDGSADFPGFEGCANLLAAPVGMTSTHNCWPNSNLLFSYGTAAPGSTPQSLVAWQTSTGLEANSIKLTATPFAGTPVSGVASSFALNGTTPALTQGPGGTACGAIDGTLSALGLPVGCSFAQPITQTLTIHGSAFAKNGANVLLAGFNLSGLEASCAQGFQPWYGTGGPPTSIGAQWAGANCVRIPLNSASYLALECCQINSAGNGWVSTTPTNADPFGNYVAAIDTVIANWQALGCSVILDLHWSAPQFTFGGVTANAMPLWQPAFMNLQNDLAFWTAISNRYGTQAYPQPGIDNTDVAFELFNEPYIDQMAGQGNSAPTWDIMKNGGTLTSFPTNGSTTAVAQSWSVVGFQTVLNAIRATGARNPVLVGGCGYAHAVSGFNTYAPTDTLSPTQVGAAIHLYSANAYPYTGGVYPLTFPDAGSGTATWAAPAQALIAAGVAVACTESGGAFSSGQTTEPYVTYVTGYLPANGFAALMEWEWWQEASGTSGTNQLLTSSGTPTPGQGTVYKAWLAGLVDLTMYSNGVINTSLWPTSNDFSFPTGCDNYTSTVNPQPGHTYSLSITGSFAGWQQATNYAVGPALGLNIAGYTKLQFDLYLATGNSAQMQFHYTRSGGDDIGVCAALFNIADYLGSLPTGVWHQNLVIPLCLLGALGQKAYYKYFIQQSASGPCQLDNVVFVPGNLAWLYDGSTAPFLGWADASVNATANYTFSPTSLNAALFALNDTLTTGPTVPQSSVNIIKVNTTALHGRWQVNNVTGFDVAPYTHFTVGLLPTVAGYAYTFQFYNTSGVAVGNAVNPAAYVVEDPGVNTTRYAVYNVPMTAFGTLPLEVGGFSIADASTQTANVFYITAPGAYS